MHVSDDSKQAINLAEALQARQEAHVQNADIDGLLTDCYSQDARVHAFSGRGQGRKEITHLLSLYYARLAGLGSLRVNRLVTGRDFIWREVAPENPRAAVELYEFQFLRDGRVYLHLLGEKRGSLLQAGDFPRPAPPVLPAAADLHRRYIALQARGDADGMANDFFARDARLVTAALHVEGAEALLSFFAQKFQHEEGFHLASIRNFTGDADYLWFEATAGGSRGLRTVYDVMLVQCGKVALQLVGTLEGNLPSDAR